MRTLIVLLIACSCSIAVAETVVEKHGQLQVAGTHLVDADGQVVQLKGVATHGLQWFGDFYKNGAVVKAAAADWNAQVVRLTVYVYEDGYLDNANLKPEDFDRMIFSIADSCIANGVYCIIDWHVHHPGFPSYYLKDAKVFFDKMARRYAGVPNILYEIANEPNKSGYQEVVGHEVTWQEIKTYAEEVIPVIREHSPDAVILVGTPAWSSLGQSAGMRWQEIAGSPLEHENILYVVHFYAAVHDFHASVDAAAEKLPLFATEWACASWKTDSQNDLERAATWLDVLNKHQIGWTYWNFAAGDSVFATFRADTETTQSALNPLGPNVTETGKLVYRFLNH